MIYKYFSLQIVVRLVLIFLNMLAISILIIHAERLFTSITLLVLLTIQIFEIIRFLTRTNREVEYFVQSLKYEEIGTRFISQTKSNKLFDAFNEILEFIENLKIQKEAQYHFLNIILKKADVGIITLTQDDKIELINDTALRILNCFKPKTWNEIEYQYPKLSKQIKQLKSEQHELIDFFNHDEKIKLSVSLTRIKILERPYSIIVFQNIRSEIEQSELDSWNRIIRTIAHEIMNSLTPISSLTETSLIMLERNNDTQNIDNNKLKTALKTIERRSNSLMHFVEDFRNLARLPKPNPTEINLKELFVQIEKLYETTFINSQITFRSTIENDNMVLYADANLIEQVLVNLMKNAIEAFHQKTNPEITLKAFTNNSLKIIEVIDNGQGIPEEDMEKLFVPFFTTKEKGSGIGLSLSRQIMQLHNGTIDIFSELNKGTTIRLAFR